MAESEEELKSFLMKGKEEREKTGLRLNIQKTKIMTSGSITSRQIDGETMETLTGFTYLDFKITADGDCSQGIKMFTPSKESCDQPWQHIKTRDIILSTKVHLFKAMTFPESCVYVRVGL